MNDVIGKLGRLLRDPGVEIDFVSFVFALLVSFLVSLCVATLYQIFYENRATGAQAHRAFPLLGPAVTAIFIAIQFSLPLSLGLLGALSIIRFRTPIKEPEETGFIMLLIAAAVICATFQFLLLFVLLAVATIALLLQRWVPRLIGLKRKDGVLLLTLNGTVGPDAKEQIRRDLEDLLKNARLESVSYADNLTSMYFSFSGVRDGSLDGLHASLNKIAPIEKLNVFFSARGAWG
ncbi:MAG TPA: DUF4956 domain-containing protein [Candidatus Eisenbacteria bacterium]|nr:DUF4956 domain-containing protein [Candidatus Eisenbacteria bacterium]